MQTPTASLRSLTRKEKMILEFIESYFKNEGIAPSFTEIKDHFGFASCNSVQHYIKQLQKKNYIHVPGGNQKRAITVLHSSKTIPMSLEKLKSSSHRLATDSLHTMDSSFVEKETLLTERPQSESLSLPLLGRVAAGQPIEALDHNEFIDVPASMLRNSKNSFALKVQGQSMIEDGIFDGDIILVQKQSQANNGDIIVANVDSEATVKRFYFHKKKLDAFNKDPQLKSQEEKVELRPANANMESLWFSPHQVKVQGIVVGLIRKF